jgi:hypothetical protein
MNSIGQGGQIHVLKYNFNLLIMHLRAAGWLSSERRLLSTTKYIVKKFSRQSVLISDVFFVTSYTKILTAVNPGTWHQQKQTRPPGLFPVPTCCCSTSSHAAADNCFCSVGVARSCFAAPERQVHKAPMSVGRRRVGVMRKQDHVQMFA